MHVTGARTLTDRWERVAPVAVGLYPPEVDVLFACAPGRSRGAARASQTGAVLCYGPRSVDPAKSGSAGQRSDDQGGSVSGNL